MARRLGSKDKKKRKRRNYILAAGAGISIGLAGAGIRHLIIGRQMDKAIKKSIPKEVKVTSNRDSEILGKGMTALLDDSYNVQDVRKRISKLKSQKKREVNTLKTQQKRNTFLGTLYRDNVMTPPEISALRQGSKSKGFSRGTQSDIRNRLKAKKWLEEETRRIRKRGKSD